MPTAPKVIGIRFIQRDLLEIQFDQLIRSNTAEFIDQANYQLLPIDGGTNILIQSIAPNLKNTIQTLSRSAYIQIKGGTVGATYSGVFKNLMGLTVDVSSLVVNPGFEGGTGQSANNWNYLDTTGTNQFNYGATRSERINYSTFLPSSAPLYAPAQQGTYGFILGDSANSGALAIAAGKYAQISQQIDMTNINSFLVDYVWDSFSPFNDYEFTVRVGSDALTAPAIYTKNSGVDSVSLNTSIDVSTIIGLNYLVFRLKSITGLRPAYGVLIENIRAISTGNIS